jgi:hypothetical protein
MIKRKRSMGWLAASSLTLLMLALAGCGGGSSDKAGTDTASSKSTATGSISATDGNSGASALSLSAPAGVTLSIPANTAFTDSSDSPVTGSIATTVSYSNQVADLPVAARTVPAGSTMVAFADVSMAGGAAVVKNFSNPAVLVFKVPAGVAATGDVLTVYSFDSSAAKWNFAGSEIVDADGNISPSVRHLSIWGLFNSATPPPVKPSGIAAAAGDGQVSLSWSAVNGATSYNVYYAASAGVTTASETKVIGAVSGQAITGLANGTAYYFVVSAVNAAGESVTSDEISASPVLPLPVRPSGLVVSGGDGQVTISWTAVSGATSYNVYWGTATGVTPGNGTRISNAISGQTITGLTNGTAYFFVVTAENSAGEGVPSTQKSVTPASTPQAPGSPTGVTVTPGAGQVTISWAPVTVATSYNVYYLLSDTTPTTATVIGTGTKVTSADSPVTVSGLATGASYWFTVTAVNVGGESAGQTKPKGALPL